MNHKHRKPAMPDRLQRWSIYALAIKTGMDERTIRRHLAAEGLLPPQDHPPMRVWWALEKLPAFKAAQHRMQMVRWRALRDRLLAEERAAV
jgi:hypothetical protein